MTRILRCAACTKRIKPHHAHVGLSTTRGAVRSPTTRILVVSDAGAS